MHKPLEILKHRILNILFWSVVSVAFIIVLVFEFIEVKPIPEIITDQVMKGFILPFITICLICIILNKIYLNRRNNFISEILLKF